LESRAYLDAVAAAAAAAALGYTAPVLSQLFQEAVNPLPSFQR